jgi:Astacin (Peptidase family M12A)
MGPETNRSLTKQVSDLAARLAKLETKLGSGQRQYPIGNEGEEAQHCALPPIPERTFGPDVSPGRARLLRVMDRKWVNGTKLRYYFFDSGSFAGGNEQKDLVREGFEAWKQLGIGVSFEEITDISEAEVRIGFLRGDGAWSYIGRDIIDIPGQVERTMNFGWDLTRDPRGVDVPVHEIGHTLGFPHEHQNPFAGIVWNEEVVYDYFGAPPNNWSRATTLYNVIRKLTAGEVEGSDWDPNSIMHYAFAAGLIDRPEQYRSGLHPAGGLSESDIAEVKRFYPPLDDAKNPQLVPFKSETLALAAGEQKNFSIVPSATREYTIQTFGNSDTVMVLFEDQNGDLKYISGDDDSGTSLNALIKARLYKGKKYVVRIRLYLNYATGDSAVMMW